MAQTGYTPIQLYYSSTTTNVPLAANLAYGELAINITDGKLFYKDNANAIQVIGWKVVPATAGGTGQTSYAVGDLIYADTTTTLAKLPDVATGNALISGGVSTAPSWGKIGLTTHVSGTLPVTNGGTGTATAFTAGSVVFAGASGVYTQDNANIFWDDTNNRLGLGTATPAQRLHVNSSGAVAARITRSDGIVANSCIEYYNGTQTWNIGVSGSNFFGINYNNAAIDSALLRVSTAGDVTVSSGNLVFGTAAKGIYGSSPFSVAIANGAAGTILDLSVAMPAGSTGIVNVYGASAGKATILCQRDQGGYYSVTELGTQPRGTYITSISLSGTNLQITNSTGGAETFSGRITLMI